MPQIPSEKKAPPVGGDADDRKNGSPPYRKQDIVMEGDSPEDLARIAGSKVLVIDDNAQNLELLVAYLDTLGCTARTAADGLQGLEKVHAEPPDLILLDVMMPRMSGFEVCRKLKSDPATRDIPILMVTALNELGDIERGVESGTDDFISKPVNRLELLTRVKSLLRVRHLKNELERTLAYLADVETRAAPGHGR